jgi:hypothetical protein
MRVLGARIEVIGDEARTTPEPGERLRVPEHELEPQLTVVTAAQLERTSIKPLRLTPPLAPLRLVSRA